MPEDSELDILERLFAVSLPERFTIDVTVKELTEQRGEGDGRQVKLSLKRANGRLMKVLESRQSIGLVYG